MLTFRQIVKRVGWFVVVIILITAPFIVRNEIMLKKHFISVKNNYPELVGKKIQFDIEAELRNHQYSLNSPALLAAPSFTLIKIVGVNCPSCYTSIQNWNNFLNNKKGIIDMNVIFFAMGEKNEAFINSLKNEKFKFLMIWDLDSSFITTNGLQNYGLQSFLLNKTGHVIQVGDPFDIGYVNKKIMKLFK